jgi:hypothetical protein
MAELERLWRRLQPLATSKAPLDVLPPGTGRFITLRVYKLSASLLSRSASAAS